MKDVGGLRLSPFIFWSVINISKNIELSYFVYKHTNLVNGKVYIGITSRLPEKRWGRNGCNYRSNHHFYNAILKYGWDSSFSHEILYSGLTKENAEEYERDLIRHFNSANPEYGYNIALGGNSVGKMSDATKKKISASNKGKRRTLEQRKKMSDIAKESSLERSERFRKIRANFKNWNDGVVFTEEQKDLIKGNTYRPVYCSELNRTFKSISFAARELDLYPELICQVCMGRRKTTGGYHFEYAKIGD